MSDPADTRRLADRLLAARAAHAPLAALPPDLVPTDGAQADAVQFAVVDTFGPIGGYKVLQVADRDGSFGAIPASRVLAAPTAIESGGATLKIELEVAFVFARGLPGRADGAPYAADEVHAAVGGAFAAFEILETRLPAGSPAIAGRADCMGNWGLVTGPAVADWRSRVHPDVAARLVVGDRTVVDKTGGHPSGDPAHSLTWLANALVAAGRPFAAGQVVTTGSLGGSHPIAVGDVVTGEIAGFAPISVRIAS